MICSVARSRTGGEWVVFDLDWQERFARNERASDVPQISITLFSVLEDFAAFLGLKMA